MFNSVHLGHTNPKFPSVACAEIVIYAFEDLREGSQLMEIDPEMLYSRVCQILVGGNEEIIAFPSCGVSAYEIVNIHLPRANSLVIVHAFNHKIDLLAECSSEVFQLVYSAFAKEYCKMENIRPLSQILDDPKIANQ